MRIRDALESDAEALASLAGRPADVMTDRVHDRTVRVAVSEPETSDDGPEMLTDERTGNGAVDGRIEDVASTVEGFVSFDVRSETVHITDFAGSRSVTRRLFEEPRRFATREGMNVEVVVADDDDSGRETVEGFGFDPVGSGPRFEGRATTRFRLEPNGDGSSTDGG